MKFTWLSNAPWFGSGYGVQTALLTPRFKADGHEVAIIAYCGLQGNVINYNGIPIFPQALHPYGQDIFIEHTKRFGTDIVLSLTDAWVIETGMIPTGFKWIPYYPVDSAPMPPPVRNSLTAAYKRITISKYGVAKTHEAGMDCYYIPHAVETKVFRPYDKAEVRTEFKLPTDAYIVGTVAMNKGAYPSRKCFAEMMNAFTLFKRKHSDAVYLLHTATGGNNPQMVNLLELINQNGLQMGKDVIFTDQYFQTVGAPGEFMAKLYSCMDVFMLTSMGEGFGIPLIEAQSCGVPVITGDWTAMGELCFSGQKVDIKDTFPFLTPQHAYQYIPKVEAIERALELERRKPSSKEKARDGALEYDIDKVYADYWHPILKEIEGGLK